MALGAQKAQRLFLREKDNTHEETLLLAQYALLHLSRLLEKPDISADIAALVSVWFQDFLKVWNPPWTGMAMLLLSGNMISPNVSCLRRKTHKTERKKSSVFKARPPMRMIHSYQARSKSHLNVKLLKMLSSLYFLGD